MKDSVVAAQADGGRSRLGGVDSRTSPLAPVLVSLGLLFALYWDVVPGMVLDWWNDPNYSHGFLVPLFSAYLVWERRERIAALELRGSWLGLPVLLVGVAMLLLGTVGAEDFLRRASLVPILAGLVLLQGGRVLFREVAFPIGFLLLAVPLPFLVFNAFAFPLQRLAARNAAWVLDVIGVPVFRDGNVIHLAHAVLGVTEACSGIRSLISLFALALAWAHLSLPSLGAKVFFVASTVPITIVANAGRVVLTGLIGQWFGMRYAQGFFHSFSGWVIFLVAAACLFAIDRAIVALHPGARK